MKVLKTKDMVKYYDAFKLGRLRCPNAGGHYKKISINLRTLFKSILGLKIDGSQRLLHDDIVAVVVFGSSVGPERKEIIKTRKKYFLFGPKVSIKKYKHIYCNDIDFLVITKDSALDHFRLEPKWIHGYDFSELVEGGVDITYRTLNQVIGCINNSTSHPYRKVNITGNDSVIESAIKNGVVIINNDKTFLWPQLAELSVSWYETNDAMLACNIARI